MKTKSHQVWIVSVVCAAIALVILCMSFSLNPNRDETAISAAEDEVYEAVVRDMVAPPHGGWPQNGQLVFDDLVLTNLRTGIDISSCKESARKDLHLENSKIPYNSLADKMYRIFSRTGYDDSLRPDTIQDFLEKYCTAGRLSQTFHTDLPRTFIAADGVGFDMWPIGESRPKSFQQKFAGANGIISFSLVGFDPGLTEAIVATSFVCGGLCGSGSRYVLRKNHGRWEVVNKWVVWVS